MHWLFIVCEYLSLYVCVYIESNKLYHTFNILLSFFYLEVKIDIGR